MSNYLAPATVTAALRLLLQERMAPEITGMDFSVTTQRPDAELDSGAAGVNIYLYQVTPNAQWRNEDAPTRDSRGQLITRPRIAVDLHYLLTFYGEDDLQAQRLLGSILHILHGQPVLTRAWIDFTRAHDDYRRFLSASDLGYEVERVKFTPQAFSLEELSKLWSVFFQTPYRLSVAYLASVVFVEAADEPVPAPPVLAPSISALPALATETAIAPDNLTGLQLWLRSDVGVVLEAGAVANWRDQSGNNRHAGQDDVAQRPHWMARGVKRQPVLHFDGSDDRLALDWGITGPLAAVTVCAVVRTLATDAQAVVSFGRDSLWELQASDGAASPRPGWVTTEPATTAHSLAADRSYDDRQWHVLMAEFAAGATSDKRLWVDGRAAGSTSAHGGQPLGAATTTRFGFAGAASNATGYDGTVANHFLHGDIAEIVVYHRVLSDDERQQLEHYFDRRYGSA